MNYKKSVLFSVLLSFALVNASSSMIGAEDPADPKSTGWLSEIFSVVSSTFKTEGKESINFAELRDTAALYLGYITAVVLIEQSVEYGINQYNKCYTEYSNKFKQAVLNSALNKRSDELGCDTEKNLIVLASEFRNPVYRYTIGLFLKNRIEKWLAGEIEKKKFDKKYTVNTEDLNNKLLIGSY